MLPTITHILYATDMSPNSTYAFRYAVRMAEAMGAHISIIYTIPEIDSAMEVPIITQMGEERYRQLRVEKSRESTGAIHAALSQFCARELEALQCSAEIRVSRVLVREGHAPSEILSAADESACDLIVMGAHGRGLLAHTFLGSVSQKVLRRSRVPVLVVPIPADVTDDNM